MDIREACNILGIEIGASKEDAKKAFKKKAIEYHPDKNKEKDAEDKFKEINAAYQLIEKNGTDPQIFNSKFYDPSDHFAEELRRTMNIHFGFGFNIPKQIHTEPVIISLEIPFETAVLGGFKEIVYERTVKCEVCTNGQVLVKKEVCPKCNGKKYRTYSNDGKELPCITCNTTGFIESSTKCKECKGEGVKKSTDVVKVNISSGMQTGMKIILREKGNYNKVTNKYDNVIATILVLQDPDMHLEGNDVISLVELSLLEALQGTKKTIRTIKGKKTLTFKPRTKNKDTIKVSGFGVPPYGSHIIIVNVTYPDNIEDIIDCLSKKVEPIPEEVSGIQN